MGVVNNVEKEKWVTVTWRKGRDRKCGWWKLIFTRIYPFINILLELFTNYQQNERGEGRG